MGKVFEPESTGGVMVLAGAVLGLIAMHPARCSLGTALWLPSAHDTIAWRARNYVLASTMRRMVPPFSAFLRLSHDFKAGSFSHHRAATDRPPESINASFLSICKSSRSVREAGGADNRARIS